MKKYSSLIFLGIMIGFGLFLRSFTITSNYYFSGELGKELLYIRQSVTTNTFPLVGMSTSHEWLSYGPIYYWIMIPIFLLFKGNPFILFWVAWVAAGIGLILNYLVIKKIIDQKVALISTIIQSVSPLLIWQTRLSKLHVFFWIIMPILMLLMHKLWNGNKKLVFLTGLLFGTLFSFHFSQIPLLAVFILMFYLKKDLYKFKDYLKFAAGILIPNITLIWQDRNLAAWLPYRVLNITEKSPSGTLNALIEYFGKNLFWNPKFWFIGFAMCIIIFIHFVYKNKDKFKTDFVTFYLISSIGIMIVANILHGAPPIHYFLPIFTTFPILLAIYLSKTKMWQFVIAETTFINLISFYKDPIFYKNFTKNVPGTDLVSYETQKQVASFITTSAKGQEVSIKRIGPYDYFPDNYSQNYKYLIFYSGGKVNDKSPKTYTIIENSEGVNVQE